MGYEHDYIMLSNYKIVFGSTKSNGKPRKIVGVQHYSRYQHCKFHILPPEIFLQQQINNVKLGFSGI